MQTSFRMAAGLAVAAAATMASADIVDAVITADNHYALYSTDGQTISYVGGNETTAGGNPGQYNWSRAETWSFDTNGVFYIAAWSDNSVAQGLLAQVLLGSLALHSGNAAWEVYASQQDIGTGSPHPTAAFIAAEVASATQNNAWEVPFVGGGNGIAPWGTIAGITNEANWTWWNDPNDANPLQGGSGNGELLIFRISLPVPTPGVAVTAGLGLAFAAGRRRR